MNLMKVVNRDITTITEGIIAHQVNCTNHIGSGVAKALIAKWPIVKSSYHAWCDIYTMEDRLKTIQLIDVAENIYVANCFSQFDKGYDGKLYTDYTAIETCFKTLNQMNKTVFMTQIYIPFNYGCGLGNGDWNIVSEIIDTHCPGVIACRI